MKLKYKKMLFFISMWIMGIGMLTFSFQKPSSDQSLPVQSSSVTKASKAESPTITSDDVSENTDTTTIKNTPEPTPTISIEEQKKLILCEDKALNSLIDSYFDAMINTDGEKLKKLVFDPTCINLKLISKTQEYIDKYDNIICYTKPGLTDGDFVVYVVYDMKLTSIKTYAPSLNPYYVTKKEDSYVLDLTLKTKGAKELLKEYNEDKDVIALLKKVNDDFIDAQESDRDLKEFIQNLKKSSGSTTETEKKDNEVLKSRG